MNPYRLFVRFGIRLSDDQAYAVDHNQMQGIINVKQIFHFQLAALTVVESKEQKREERDPLIARKSDGEKN